MRAGGALTLESIFQEWNHAYAAAELEDPSKAGRRTRACTSHTGPALRGKQLLGRERPGQATRTERTALRATRRTQDRNRVFKVSLDERLGSIDLYYRVLSQGPTGRCRRASCKSEGSLEGATLDVTRKSGAQLELQQGVFSPHPPERRGPRRRRRTRLETYGAYISRADSSVSRGFGGHSRRHDDHSDLDKIDLQVLSGKRGMNRFGQFSRPGRTASIHCQKL